MSVVGIVHETHDLLCEGQIDHAFGGALAFAYYAEPRGTLDVDVNVFVPFDDAQPVVGEFDRFGFFAEKDPEDWSPQAGVRLHRGNDLVAIGLFFSIDELYEGIAERVCQYPFAGRDLPFLSAEDLAMFKLSFGRRKDWVDLGYLAEYRPLDIDDVERQLIAHSGPTMYPRVARFRAMFRNAES